MAWKPGTSKADEGMSLEIYSVMAQVLGSGISGLDENKRKSIEDGWKQLSYIIAAGVMKYLGENMEISFDPATKIGKVIIPEEK